MPTRPAPDWRHSIVSRTSMAIAGIATIGVIVIGTSERIAERIQGSGVSINEAGSLRRVSHRLVNLALTATAAQGQEKLREAIGAFDVALQSNTLREAIERTASDEMTATFEQIATSWQTQVKPHLLAYASKPGTTLAEATSLLAEIDQLVIYIDDLVRHLETDTEDRIRHLRLTLAASLALILILVVPTLILLRRRVALPMEQLIAGAGRVARGDFTSPINYTAHDELGYLARSFDLMSTQLASLYNRMEHQVEAKTAELSRSNRSLKLLYDSISHLYNASNRPESYRKVLDDLEEVLGLSGSMLCQLPKHQGTASIVTSTIGDCEDRSIAACLKCPEFDGQASIVPRRRKLQAKVPMTDKESTPLLKVVRPNGVSARLRQLPLVDADRRYGVLRVLLEAHQELEPWQEMLLEAVARHIGIALGISFQSERDRLVALQEERSTIARELHDSLAQSLSYMKIQASLLQPLLSDPERSAQAQVVLNDLREGINSAYRQLRELLSTFRLGMEGDFLNLLNVTVDEYRARSGVPISLETRLEGCHLTPNQEIHSLHVVREALSNMTRHARASHARIVIEYRDPNEVVAIIEDDGVGPFASAGELGGHHGTSIMKERARTLGGSVNVAPREGGGTRVTLRFPTVMTAAEAQTDHV